MRASHLETAFPFCDRGVVGGSGYFPWVNVDPFPLKQIHGIWHKVEILYTRLKLFVDPSTSATSASSIEYVIPQYREAVLTELDLCRPGMGYDVLSGPNGIGGPFRWAGGLSVPFPPGDDVFNLITWTAYVDLFGCEAMPNWWVGSGATAYPLPFKRYVATADELLWTPTFRLGLSAVYDDGSEGEFWIQTADPTTYIGETPGLSDGLKIPLVGKFDGVPFDAYAIGFSPSGSGTYAFGGAAPEVEITREFHYEYRTKAGTHPLLDVATGDLLPGANPGDGRL